MMQSFCSSRKCFLFVINIEHSADFLSDYLRQTEYETGPLLKPAQWKPGIHQVLPILPPKENSDLVINAFGREPRGFWGACS